MLDFLKWGKTKPRDGASNPTLGKWTHWKEGLHRTRKVFSEGISSLFQEKKTFDPNLLEALEAFLLSADVGLASTKEIIKDLTMQLQSHKLKNSEELVNTLKQALIHLLVGSEVPLRIEVESKPFIIVMVGVNGTGKTTTIGKLAKKFKHDGKTIMLAAGDTFRAAAVEQLKVWGARNQIPVIAQESGADSASVIFDALQAAKAKKIDILIADTAGRLHTQETLMEELKKIVRIIRKVDKEAPHEIMLVLDAGVGQNALVQAKKFHEALGVTGITLTKLDGTAKGGIIFNIAKTLKIPIRFIGMGEGIEDLRSFEAVPFVEALFEEKTL